MDGSMYFIAIIPPLDICEAITNFKLDVAERFNSRHALKLIPHITLKAPFSYAKNQHDEILRWFNELQVDISPFSQRLKDFKCFDKKKSPVIFIEPELSRSLSDLQIEILLQFQRAFPALGVTSNEKQFHPHVTIAFRDLSYDNFKKAWQEYNVKRFEAVFTVDNFHLLQHDRKQWNSVAQYYL